jgi:hypothetical protein
MQIIFDENLASELKERYTVLELDTVQQPDMPEPIRLHALVEHIPLQEMPDLENLIELHKQLMSHYKNGEWALVEHAVAPLMGKWRGDLDTFYQEVLDFSAECAKLNTKWDGVRRTVPNE